MQENINLKEPTAEIEFDFIAEDLEYDMFTKKEEKLLAKMGVLKDLLAAGVAIPFQEGIQYNPIIVDDMYRNQLQDMLMALTKNFLGNATKTK
jgi:hypothetical protein